MPAEVFGAGRWAVDPAFAARLGGADGRTILAADQVISTVADKAAAWQRTGAAAVDLESGAVAAVAAAHRLPFAVLRAVCDPAGRALPPLAATALDARGRVRTLNLLLGLLRHPGEISALRALGQDAAAARRALAARVADIGRLDRAQE